LGILAILVGINFYYQKDYSSVSDREKYCHGCSKKIGISDKYCANFGGKL
jgi:rRNA maturation endonuclease Nob1